MPEYLCVCCFRCRVYQVVAATKSGQFRCRLCNSKQFFRTIFKRAARAQDVRGIVQELNAQKEEQEEEEEEETAGAAPVDEATEKDPIDWNQFLSPVKELPRTLSPEGGKQPSKEDGRGDLSTCYAKKGSCDGKSRETRPSMKWVHGLDAVVCALEETWVDECDLDELEIDADGISRRS